MDTEYGITVLSSTTKHDKRMVVCSGVIAETHDAPRSTVGGIFQAILILRG